MISQIRSGLLLALIIAPVSVFAQNTAYQTLLKKVQSGDLTVDFKQLRIEYAKTPEYDSFDESDLDKRMYVDLNKEDFKSALKTANKILENKFVSLDAQYGASVAEKELGDSKASDFHKNVLFRLLDSIKSGGDGMSTATAWTVIEIHEEYFLLEMLGYPRFPVEQSYSSEKGHRYDSVTVQDPKSKKQVTFYFNTDIPDQHLDDALKDTGPKK